MISVGLVKYQESKRRPIKAICDYLAMLLEVSYEDWVFPWGGEKLKTEKGFSGRGRRSRYF